MAQPDFRYNNIHHSHIWRSKMETKLPRTSKNFPTENGHLFAIAIFQIFEILAILEQAASLQDSLLRHSSLALTLLCIGLKENERNTKTCLRKMRKRVRTCPKWCTTSTYFNDSIRIVWIHTMKAMVGHGSVWTNAASVSLPAVWSGFRAARTTAGPADDARLIAGFVYFGCHSNKFAMYIHNVYAVCAMCFPKANPAFCCTSTVGAEGWME